MDRAVPSQIASGLRTLVDWPWVTVEIECSLCRRHGRYRLARLAERHGAGIELGPLLLVLAAHCGLNKPGIKPRRYEARCGVRYRVPGGGPLPQGVSAREAAPGEVWPPKLRRLGPQGPLPTIGDSRRHGIAAVRVCCEGLIRGNFCHHVAEMALDVLDLPDETTFVHIPRLRRFRCRRCGGTKVRVLPSWPDARGTREDERRPMLPGTMCVDLMPGLGERPTPQ